MSREPRPLIVSLSGGLGNQLFQWASGYGLASSRGLDLTVSDIEVGPRGFQLADFNIQKAKETISERSKLAILRRKQKESLKQKIVWNLKYPFLSSRVVEEQGFGFDSTLKKRIGPHKILKGTLQSERYFAELSPQVKKLLLSGFQARPTTVEALKSLNSTDWAAVHVRRGDYLRFTGTFGLLGPEYFSRARDELIKIFGSKLRFVLFSDDPTEAQKVCDWADTVIASSFGSPSQPLGLMSRASAIIGSNSSYSWWSSFLASDGTPAIFPSPWFPGDKPIGKDVIPSWAMPIERSDLCEGSEPT